MRECGYEIVHVRFLSLIRCRTVSAGIYVLSLLVDDTMSTPSNTRSSGGLLPGRNRCGRKHVNLGALLSSSLSSSLSLSLLLGGAGVGVGAGGVGVGVQWRWWVLVQRTARPVWSDSLNASRVLRRHSVGWYRRLHRIYNKGVKLSSFTNCGSVRVVHMVPA